MSNNCKSYSNKNYSLVHKSDDISNDNDYPNEYVMQSDTFNAIVVVQNSNESTSIVYPSPLIIIEAH